MSSDIRSALEVIIAALDSHERLSEIEAEYEHKVAEYGERCAKEVELRVEEERLRREEEIVALEKTNNKLRAKRRRLVEALDNALDRNRVLKSQLRELHKKQAAS